MCSTRPRAATSTTSCSSANAPAPSSSLRIADPTNGLRRLRTPFARRARSTASPATPTTSSSTANRIGRGSSPGCRRTSRSEGDEPVHAVSRGALGGSPTPTPVSSPPPPSARRALRRPHEQRKDVNRVDCAVAEATAMRAQARVDKSGGKGFEKPGSLPAENRHRLVFPFCRCLQLTRSRSPPMLDQIRSETASKPPKT